MLFINLSNGSLWRRFLMIYEWVNEWQKYHKFEKDSLSKFSYDKSDMYYNQPVKVWPSLLV